MKARKLKEQEIVGFELTLEQLRAATTKMEIKLQKSEEGSLHQGFVVQEFPQVFVCCFVCVCFLLS